MHPWMSIGSRKSMMPSSRMHAILLDLLTAFTQVGIVAKALAHCPCLPKIIDLGTHMVITSLLKCSGLLCKRPPFKRLGSKPRLSPRSCIGLQADEYPDSHMINDLCHQYSSMHALNHIRCFFFNRVPCLLPDCACLLL